MIVLDCIRLSQMCQKRYDPISVWLLDKKHREIDSNTKTVGKFLDNKDKVIMKFNVFNVHPNPSVPHSCSGTMTQQLDPWYGNTIGTVYTVLDSSELTINHRDLT